MRSFPAFHKSKRFFIPSFIVVLFCVCLFLVPLAHATTYYVDSAGGLDSNNGTSRSTPWQTIAKVNSSTFNPGDNIFLKAGDTWHGQTLNIPSSGASGTPITFGSYGSGTQPLITESVLANTTSSWTQATGTVSGSVSQPNMRLSLASTTAFVDFGAAGELTPYIGDELTITDSSGHTLVGYIKAAGIGETYGSQLLPNPSLTTSTSIGNYDSTFSIIPSGGQSGGAYLQVTPTAPYGWANQTFSLTSGMLIRNSVYMEAGTETNWLWFTMTDPSYNTLTTSEYYNKPSSWTQYVLYATADETASGFMQTYMGASSGLTSRFDTASAEQVLTPSVTGVTIVSIAGGSSYNWTSEQSGFNPDDQNGYSYSISGVSLSNVWETTVRAPIDPNTVWRNSVPLNLVGSTASLTTSTQYAYSSPSVYVYATSNPVIGGNTFEIPQNNYALFASGTSYIDVNGLELRGANDYGLYGVGNVSGLAVTGNTMDRNAAGGMEINEPSATITNLLVNQNTVNYNGGSGISANVDHQSNWQIKNNTVDHNSQVQISSSYWQYTAGIYFNCSNTGNVAQQGPLVSGNTVTNGGSTYMTGTSAWTQGAGIWSDTCDHATVTDNYTSDNYGPGLILEKNNSSTLSYNVSNNDDVVGTVNATDTCSVASLLVRVGESINGSGNQIYNNTVSGGWWGIANGDFYNCNGSDGSIAGNDIFRNNIAVNALSHNFFAGVGGNNNGTNGSGNIYDHNNFGAPGSTLAYWTGVGAISTYSALNAAYGSNMNNIQLNPLFVSTSTASMTVGEMQSLLVSLESQLQALETKAGITTNSSSYIFTRNLTIGSRGMDVQALQHYLNTHGFPVNSTLTYAGSLGYETQYFGTATQAALAEFQKSVSITPAVGYFGSITMAWVNGH